MTKYVPQKEDDNRFGAETFTKEDLDVLEDIDRIHFIFDIASEGPNGFVDLDEFKKFYELLEKGYRLSIYQKRRISNAYLFSKKRHEKIIETALNMNEMLKKSEEDGKISAFSPDFEFVPETKENL